MNQIELNKLQSETYDHLWNGRYRLALKSAQTLYEHRSNDSEAAICLAWALLENGQPAQSIEYANQAVELNGDSIRTHLCRGYILMRLSVFEGAISDLDKTIEEQKILLSWSYLNKARALAGERKFEDAKTAFKFCQLIEQERASAWKNLEIYYNTAYDIHEGLMKLNNRNVKKLIKLADSAVKDKEFWFVVFIAELILENKKFKEYHDALELLELDAMLKLFRFRPGLEKAEMMKDKFEKNEKFKQIYDALLKMKKDSQKESDLPDKPKNLKIDKTKTEDTAASETEIHEKLVEINKSDDEHDDNEGKSTGRTDAAYYPNDNFEPFSIKMFDYEYFMKKKKKKYFHQFNISRIKEIGLEVVFSNPHFRIQNKVFNCYTSWYLNDFEIFRNNFSLKVDKSWDSVIFNQQCGEEEEISWAAGQGKVELYVEGMKVCEKWYFLNSYEIEEEVKENDKVEAKDSVTTEKSNKESSDSDIPAVKARPIEELLSELDEFTGLDNVKKAIRDFIDFLKFQKEREKMGLKVQQDLSLHSLFLGNPGTGKTTIARMLGEIFKALGILEKGHVIDTDRSGLVGQYVGETAQKTDKLINDAMGGVLFIDEAYTLAKPGGSGQDFGQEAIDILLKRMEDKKGEFIVVAAGYTDEMKAFIDSNPGLKSRFNHTFEFEDYTPDEMIEIFKKYAENEEYKWSESTIELLNKEFINLFRARDKTFGNARLVRQLFEQAKLALSKRYLNLPKEAQNEESMTKIEVDDIKDALKTDAKKQYSVQIDEDALNESLAELKKLVGLDSVKRDIRDIIKLVRYYNEQGENIKDKFSSHILFLGNPGTGKTTVARIVGKIYSSLGILPKGHLIEVDRQALVAQHVGGTAEKTTQAIDSATGGTLFIDEAYSLAPKGSSGSDFGKEAIDTLLKRMEDDRGKFIVIAAGYTDEMKNFISSNPGIQSRFTKTFSFEDYTPHEMMTIAERMTESMKCTLNDDAREKLLQHFNELYRERDKQFGNARIVRNLLEKIQQCRLLRIADIPQEERSKINQDLILPEDIDHCIGTKQQKAIFEIKGDPQKLEALMEELNNLIGLSSVKNNVEKLISSLKVAKLRKERGLKVIGKNLHSVFVGNPGTGKTTVARLLSKIYKELGLLERGHLIEVDRSDLVAGYTGQTAIKTDKLIESAMGGTLFIDEAYTLSRGSNDFGQEAIDTLLKKMEDNGDELVIIVAGYTNEMKVFLDSNPGLKSRFTNIFTFEDYTPRQLLEIAHNIASDNGYTLDEGALQIFLNVFEDLYAKRDNNFGNARTARNILYKAISIQEERISSMYDYKDADLTTIMYEDVADIKVEEIQ